jgi:Flp pilus assembly protein TadD
MPAKTPQASSWPRSPWKNARPDVKYVGDAACARCHADIAETFRHHPMGRSLAPINKSAPEGVGRPDTSITFEAGSSRLTIERRGGREVHREARLDAQGQVLAEAEAEVSFALGSGTLGTSYLIEHEGRLFQSPISWYGQKNRWDLSPGYERDNPHFTRPIEPNCLFCHSSRVEPVALTANKYEQPIFRGEAIGCERCHGPGELHARRQEVVDGRDLTIVNPRHLEPALRAAVCEQCHLLGDYRVDRVGRATFDYRPGLPTSAFFAVYGRTSERTNTAVGHVEQLKASQCFRESEGRLSCTSCHDPHEVPAPQEKTAYFRQQCVTCHEKRGCSLPDPVRLAESHDDNCVQCHMPRSTTADIVHTATTDHRILRTYKQLLAEPTRAAPALPLVLLNGDGLPSSEVELLERELAIALTDEGPRLPDTPAVRQIGANDLFVLGRAIARHPEDVEARRMMARALTLSSRRAEALRLVESVLESAPSYEKALDDFTAFAIDEGQSQAALAPARRAVELNPWSAAFHERLAHVLLEGRDWPGALSEARAALKLDPFRWFARMFTVQGLLHQNDLEQARTEFATLIKLHPSQRESLEEWFGEQRRNQKN